MTNLLFAHAGRASSALKLAVLAPMPSERLGGSIGGMDLAEIQHAIEELPKDQQAALAAWIAERDQAEWEEIERDFSPIGGALIDEMKAEIAAPWFPLESCP